MPEGPEVQIVADILNQNFKGKSVVQIQIHDKRWLSKHHQLARLKNSTLINVSRRAKYLVMQFSTNYVLNHLSMSGNWIIRKSGLTPVNTRLTLVFENGVVDFIDPRRFGRLDVFDQEEFFANAKIQTKLGGYGLDVLTETLTEQYLIDRIKQFKPTDEIKPTLMNQNFLAGIGNIYASEICFLSGISPFRKLQDLKSDDLFQLIEAVTHILKTAYSSGGSTIRTFKNPRNEKGYTEHMIYGKKICRICMSKTSRGPQLGRTTYWCSKCQS